MNQLNIHVPLQFREMHKMMFCLLMHYNAWLNRNCVRVGTFLKGRYAKKPTKFPVFCRCFAEIIFITRAVGRNCHWGCTRVRQGARGGGESFRTTAGSGQTLVGGPWKLRDFNNLETNS